MSTSRPALPTYDDLLWKEGPLIDKAYLSSTRRPIMAGEVRTTAYRRLWEGWMPDDILAAIADPARVVQFPGGPTDYGGRPDYPTYVAVEGPAVDQAYRNAHEGVGPAPADIRHNAWRRFVEGWTQDDILKDILRQPNAGPTLRRFDGGPSVSGAVGARAGIVRAVDRRHFGDDTGRYNPLGGTLLWALWGWKFDRDRVKRNLQYILGTCDYARFLGQVNWSGEEISEAWPDYVDQVRGLLDYAGSLGRRLQITAIGGGVQNPDLLINHVIDAVRGRERLVQQIEVANESFKNFADESRLKALGDRLRAALPQTLVALSSPKDDAAARANRAWVPQHANMGMAHGDRDDTKSDWKWRHVRKPWELGQPDCPSSHNEPGGPRSTVAEFPEAIHNAMIRATAILCGWDDVVLHNAAGVTGRVDPARNRPANVWEVPGIGAIMVASRGIDALIPPWGSNGVLTRGGGDGGVGPHPLKADNYWPDGGDHGVVRDYARVNGNEFWQVLLGVKDHVNVKADRNYRLTFQDPITHSTQAQDVNAGQTIRVGLGSVDSRHLGAWIVRGVVR